MKKHLYKVVFTICLTIFNIYALLKTFVLPTEISKVGTNRINTSQVTNNSNENGFQNITENSYEDENIKISIEKQYINNTYVYIADVYVSSSEYLKTALAKGTFGTNVTEETSTIAKENNAIFAVNGDYYGANSKGYVIKQGVVYRNSVKADTSYEDLAIYKDGSFKLINESEISAEELVNDGVENLLSFGPTLIKNGEISISQNTEVAKAMSTNPRTAVGMISDNHYIFLVSDGRTTESAGLSLYAVAEIMKDLGCKTAYNLDGGGSSTMYFNGNIVNKPTTNGKTIKERAVSDILYIGY